MVNTRYIYCRNFFYKLSQERFLNKVSELEDKGYRINVTNLCNSGSAISSIRNGKINKNNKSFIPDTVAESIKNNLVINYGSETNKKECSYLSLSEIFWGQKNELQEMELEFFYCLVKDMLCMFKKTKRMSCSYTILAQNFLKNSVEYANVLSLLNVENLYRTMNIKYNHEFNTQKEITYADSCEWKETNLEIPKKIYRFIYSEEEDYYGWPLFYGNKKGNNIFSKVKLEDIIKLEDKSIIFCYEKFIKQCEISKLFFTTLKEFVITRRVTVDGNRIMKPFNKPTFEVIEKVLDEFIEEKLIPILKENEPTIKDLSFRIHDILFYRYINILNLIGLDYAGEIFEDTENFIEEEFVTFDENERKYVKVKTKLPEAVEKKEHEYTRVLLEKDRAYVESIIKVYYQYSQIDNNELYSNRIKEYKKKQFSIMAPENFVKYDISSELVGIEFRKILGKEEYLLIGDKYNIV